MTDVFLARLMRFDTPDSTQEMSLAQAVRALDADEADAIVLDIIPHDELQAWWDDEGFSSAPFTKNDYNAGLLATSVTIGQLQREERERLVSKAAEYFGMACKVNEGLRQTRFVRLFGDALDARPLTLGHEYEVEFLMATRRVYEPYEAPFNFAPHCDDVSFARDVANWPMKQSYPQQIAAFLTIQGSQNDAGLIIWNHRPMVRTQLEAMNLEYRETGTMAQLAHATKIELKPQPGQLTLFHSKNMHAVERCSSTRRTMGLFLIHHESGWRFFN